LAGRGPSVNGETAVETSVAYPLHGIAVLREQRLGHDGVEVHMRVQRPKRCTKVTAAGSLAGSPSRVRCAAGAGRAR